MNLKSFDDIKSSTPYVTTSKSKLSSKLSPVKKKLFNDDDVCENYVLNITENKTTVSLNKDVSKAELCDVSIASSADNFSLMNTLQLNSKASGIGLKTSLGKKKIKKKLREINKYHKYIGKQKTSKKIVKNFDKTKEKEVLKPHKNQIELSDPKKRGKKVTSDRPNEKEICRSKVGLERLSSLDSVAEKVLSVIDYHPEIRLALITYTPIHITRFHTLLAQYGFKATDKIIMEFLDSQSITCSTAGENERFYSNRHRNRNK